VVGPGGECREFGAIRDAELRVDMGQVGLDCLPSHQEPVGDLRVGKAQSHFLDDVLVGPRETCPT